MGWFSSGSIYPNPENENDRDLAQKAGGFTSRNDADQEQAYNALVKKHGKSGAKKRVETEAISAGAKPKGAWRRLTGR